jgi:hypothetical protein
MFQFLLPLPPLLRRTAFEQLKALDQLSSPHLQLQALRTQKSRAVFSLPRRRLFCSTSAKMSDLSIELTAPNGVKYTQPTGLFINNEWVKSSDGKKITSINPTYVNDLFHVSYMLSLLTKKATSLKSLRFTQLPLQTSTPQLQQPEKPLKTPPGATYLLQTVEIS